MCVSSCCAAKITYIVRSTYTSCKFSNTDTNHIESFYNLETPNKGGKKPSSRRCIKLWVDLHTEEIMTFTNRTFYSNYSICQPLHISVSIGIILINLWLHLTIKIGTKHNVEIHKQTHFLWLQGIISKLTFSCTDFITIGCSSFSV